MAQKKKVAKKVQRTQRPACASKKSLGIQVLILFILFQLVSLLTVQISGRGTAYLYMMLPLMIITYGGWLCVNRMHADVPFFLDTAMLLTFGTMIQCLLLKQDEMPTSLIVIYVLAAVAGVIAAIVYKHAPMIASAVGTSILMVLSVILYMATLLIGKAVGGGVRNWINIAGFSLQPSEFNKIIYVLVMAGLLHQGQAGTQARLVRDWIHAGKSGILGYSGRVWYVPAHPVYIPLHDFPVCTGYQGLCLCHRNHRCSRRGSSCVRHVAAQSYRRQERFWSDAVCPQSGAENRQSFHLLA